jgi:hypothetical protein
MNGGAVSARPAGLAGWQVEIADARKVQGLAQLAYKTARIDAWVPAELLRSLRRGFYTWYTYSVCSP